MTIYTENAFVGNDRISDSNLLTLGVSTRLLDPDTGLEVKNPTQRHLLFEEVKKIYDHMDNYSILMIYQHIPRVVREGYIGKRCNELAVVTAVRPETITDNEIVFFVMTKNPLIRTRICAVLEEYAEKYNVLSTCDCAE